MGKCKKCKYFKSFGKLIIRMPNIFQQIRLRLTHVCGFCMDSENPDFNEFAKCDDRGIGKIEAILRPKWCRFRGKKNESN